MNKYSFIKLGFRIVLKVLTKTQVRGLENVPAQGPFILAVNHLTMLEPPLLLVHLPIERITVMVAKKWQSHWFVNWVITWVGGIYVNREQLDVQALKASLAVLKQGGVLGMAPEGTRSRTGGLIQGKTGVAYLATKTQVPILPVGVSGQVGYQDYLKRGRRIPLRVQIGPPITLPPLQKGDRSAQLEAATETIMLALARLIDPHLRGVYAERLAEVDSST